MKKRSCFLVLMSVLLLFCFLTGCEKEEETPPDYNTVMSELDPSTANGTLITGYDITKRTYLETYIPEGLLASTPEEVGYMLRMDLSAGETSQQYYGPLIFGDYVSIEFVDCSTGEVLAQRTFEPYFPEEVPANYRATPLASDVITWVEHIYSQVEDGPRPDHVWSDATCLTAATCSICGLVQEEPGCHVWNPDGCSVCGEVMASEYACHRISWNFSPENYAMMEGTCSGCGQDFSGETDWSFFMDHYGQWQLDYYSQDAEMIYPEQSVTMLINTDGTLLITTAEAEHHFTWTYDYGHVNESREDTYAIYYKIVDEAGNKYKLSHLVSSDSTFISIRSSEYVLHFEQ